MFVESGLRRGKPPPPQPQQEQQPPPLTDGDRFIDGADRSPPTAGAYGTTERNPEGHTATRRDILRLLRPPVPVDFYSLLLSPHKTLEI